jgi:mRNA interferase MazF
LVIVVPITTRQRGFTHHIAITGGGLERPSFAMPEYVRSIAQRRLQRRLGLADGSTMATLEDWLRRLIGL